MGLKNDIILKVIETLEQIHSLPQKPSRKIPILDQLIIHIIGSGEKSEDIELAYHCLLEEFVDWNEVRVSNPREIHDVLEKYLKHDLDEKSLRIRDVLFQIFNICNELNLEFLWEKDITEIQKFFQEIHGLKENFLTKFISYSYYQPTANLSVALLRIAKRINLWEENDSQIVHHDSLSSLTTDDLSRLNMLLHLHGATICLPRAYRCEKCVIKDFCEKGHECLQKQKEKTTTKIQKPRKAKKSVSTKEKSITARKIKKKTKLSETRVATGKDISSRSKKAEKVSKKGEKTKRKVSKQVQAKAITKKVPKKPPKAKKTKKIDLS